MRRPLKYRNVPVEVDGVRHASKAEARRWGELQLLQRAGEIEHLRRQPRYPLEVNGQLVAVYVADATYRQNNEEVVEDTKSPATRKNPVYRLKRKLMQALYGIQIREVG